MSRVGDLSPEGEYWSDCWRGRHRPDETPDVNLPHDDDRKIVGHILDAKGDKLHTVKRPGAVEFGYRR